jgi:hypothetical protein
MNIETKFNRHNYTTYLLPSILLVHNPKTYYAAEDYVLHINFLKWHWYITFTLNKK